MKTFQSILSVLVIFVTSPIWITKGYIALGNKVYQSIKEGINGTTN
jgi:hypothetical protein